MQFGGLPKSPKLYQRTRMLSWYVGIYVSLELFWWPLQCLSGRGDKDVEQISELLPKWADKLDWHAW